MISIFDTLVEFWQSLVTGFIILLMTSLYLYWRYKNSIILKIGISFSIFGLSMGIIGIIVGKNNVYFSNDIIGSIFMIMVASIIVLLIILFLSKTVTIPLLRLDEASKQLLNKNFDIELPNYSSNDEIGALSNSLIELYVTTKEVETQRYVLEQEKILVEKIIASFPDGIVVLDTNGTIILSNRIFQNIYFQIFNHELLPGTNITHHNRELLLSSFEKIILGELDQIDPIEHIKGRFYQIFSSKFSDKIIIEIHDVSSFVEYDQLQKQFISTISHELRTPLTAIILSVNNLIKYKEKLSEMQKDTGLKRIQQNSISLSEMIEDLLLISSIESKKVDLFYSNVVVSTLIQNVIFSFESLIKLKNINIQVTGDQKAEINCDNKRISQVIRILLENAVKYSPENTNIVVNIIKRPMNKEISIKIVDQGFGIKIEDIPFIFDRFYRSSDVNNISGTGLGLAIAKEIVELHHGSISVSSEKNKGSAFEITIPENNLGE